MDMKEFDDPITVLHVLANSSPDLNGYAVRSHDMLKSQINSKKVHPIAITSPYYPERRSMTTEYEKDGVLYLRCKHLAYHDDVKGPIRKWIARRGRKKIPIENKNNSKKVNLTRPKKGISLIKWNLYWMTIHTFRLLKNGLRVATKPVRSSYRLSTSWLEEKIQFKHFEEFIEKAIDEHEPDIIHAHTPYRVGIPAMNVAKKRAIPFIYEMRGIWEDTAVINGRWRSWGLAYRRFRHMENKVLQGAEAVYCISEQLKMDIINRGVEAKKIRLVRNAVDDERFTENQSDTSIDESVQEISDMLNKSEQTIVIGYIGSIQKLEGLDLLAESVRILKMQDRDIRLLIISTKKNQDEYKKTCNQLGIGDISIVAGPISRDYISNCYNLIDIFVVCRPPGYRVTEKVTPLKPFEAMAKGLPVIISDLPALKEIVEDEYSGLCFKAGNVNDLAEKISALIRNPEKRIELGSTAQNWVREHRVWSKVVKSSIDGYYRLLQP